MITLALGLLFSRFESFLAMDIPVFSFLSGLFMGLSVAMNLAYVVSIRQNFAQRSL
jgi:Na+-translocating ferredoxin:NAD+ oxidoreductase RnfE subunit